MPNPTPTTAPGSPPRARHYRSGAYRIDLEARILQLHRQEVAVEAKVFDLIALLVEHAERALDKREISDHLWGNRPVTDAALSQLLRKARRVLGDSGDTQRMIRTVHGRGLQWVAPLEAYADPHAPAEEHAAGTANGPSTVLANASTGSRQRRFPLWSGAAALLVAGVLVAAVWWLSTGPPTSACTIRLAITPTNDQTGEPELAWVRRGLPGLISGLISRQHGTEIVTTDDQPAFGIGGDAGSERQRLAWRDALGATHVLNSELRRLGPLYELEVHLSSLAGGNDYSDVLRGDNPSVLAADAAARTQARLRPRDVGERFDITINDPFVAEVYARGLDAQIRGDHASARKYFEICLDHDPRLLQPRLQLAISEGVSGHLDASQAQALRVAEKALARNDAELHARALRQLARLEHQRGNVEGAARQLDAAMSGMPAVGHDMLRIDLLVARGVIANEQGRSQPADDDFRRALTLALSIGDRRREALALLNLAVVEVDRGDTEATIATLRSGLGAARSAGDGALEMSALLNLAGAENNAGRPLDAIVLLKQNAVLAIRRSDPAMHLFTLIGLARITGAFDHFADAQAYADAALRIAIAGDNALWQAEARWALASLAERQGHWRDANSELDQAFALLSDGGMNRIAMQVAADMANLASRQGDLRRVERAASLSRELIDHSGDSKPRLAAFLPLINAQIRYLRGERQAAVGDLERLLTERGSARDAMTSAVHRQLARWRLELRQAAGIVDQPAWREWLRHQPDATALYIDALRAADRKGEADAEQARLEALRRSPELAFDAGLLPQP